MALRWFVVHGIHRRVLTTLLSGAVVGVVFGWFSRGAFLDGALVRLGLLAVVMMAVLTPLGWVATWRIARPVAELARVAGRLRHGMLTSRAELGDDDGEVGEVAEALRGLSDRLSTQLSHQRALMAAVSHELRSPLARVRVLVELGREGMAPEGFHDDLQAEIDGMDALVGDLLAGARIDFEAVSPRALDPAEAARRALELAGESPELLQIATSTAVEADPNLVARALAVLLDNARRHGGAPTAVRVDDTDDGDHVRFEVADDGPGFGPGEEIQAFEPFWRRPGERAEGGVGLGLALVRQIAEAHGGRTGAFNGPGGGAVVYVELPAADRAG